MLAVANSSRSSKRKKECRAIDVNVNVVFVKWTAMLWDLRNYPRGIGVGTWADVIIS